MTCIPGTCTVGSMEPNAQQLQYTQYTSVRVLESSLMTCTYREHAGISYVLITEMGRKRRKVNFRRLLSYVVVVKKEKRNKRPEAVGTMLLNEDERIHVLLNGGDMEETCRSGMIVKWQNGTDRQINR
jgi:hypothetical protein